MKITFCNTTGQAIIFTGEATRQDGSMPFLDTIVTPEQNIILFISVYRKPTCTDQYFHWDSHYHIAEKYSAINTLVHIAKQFLPPQNCLELNNNIQGRAQPNPNILLRLHIGWSKRICNWTSQAIIMISTLMAMPTITIIKTRGILLFLKSRVCANVLRTFIVVWHPDIYQGQQNTHEHPCNT